jgi:hypothetical protein
MLLIVKKIISFGSNRYPIQGDPNAIRGLIDLFNNYLEK